MSKKSLLLLPLITVLILSGCAAIPVTPASDKFTLNYPDGMKYTETTVMKMEQSGNLPVKVSKLSTTKARTSVSITRESGDFKLASKMLAYTIETDDGEADTTLLNELSKALVGTDITLTIGADGTIKGLEGLDNILDSNELAKLKEISKNPQLAANLETLVAKMLKDMIMSATEQYIKDFINRPAKKGSAWTTNLTLPFGKTGLTILIDYKVGNAVKCGKRSTCVEVDYNYTIDSKSIAGMVRTIANLDAMPADMPEEKRREIEANIEKLLTEMEKNLKVEGTGKTTVDPSTMIRYRDTSKMTTNIKMAPLGIPLEITSTMDMEYHIEEL